MSFNISDPTTHLVVHWGAGAKELLQSISEKQGKKMNSVDSAKDIPEFLKFFKARLFSSRYIILLTYFTFLRLIFHVYLNMYPLLYNPYPYFSHVIPSFIRFCFS